jgi:hypothetical protein
MDAVRAQAARDREARAVEIDKEIIAILGAQGLRTEEEIDERLPTLDANKALRLQLTRLRTVERRYKREAIKETRKHAKGIIKTIDRLQRQIEDAPTILKLSLGLVDLGPLDPTKKRKREIDNFLNTLRHQCGARLSNLPRSDRVKLECARAGYYLISAYTKGKPTSSEDSPFREITGLLYERITGTKDRDLKVACEKLLREKIKPLARRHAFSRLG